VSSGLSLDAFRQPTSGQAASAEHVPVAMRAGDFADRLATFRELDGAAMSRGVLT
jgi:hypothetical protein